MKVTHPKLENLVLKSDCKEVDWVELADLYAKAPLGERDPEKLMRAFRNSYKTLIALNDSKIVGAARAISDGEYYCGVFDVAVLPEHQGCGLGRLLMDELMKQLEGKFVVLTTTTGKEDFYRKFGFRRHLTAMAVYPDSNGKSAQTYLGD